MSKHVAVFDDKLKDDIEYSLKERLIRASVKRELLDVTGIEVPIGKTQALCEVAYEFELPLIVRSEEEANAILFSEEWGGLEMKVYSVDYISESHEDLNITQALIDLGVNSEWVESILNIEVVTGFVKVKLK